MTLAVALALAAGGVWASAVTGFGQGLGIIGFMICTPWLLSIPAHPDTLRKRRMLFGGAALSQGLLLAPLVRAALAVHPGVLFTALGGTAGACVLGARAGCASGAALMLSFGAAKSDAPAMPQEERRGAQREAAYITPHSQPPPHPPHVQLCSSASPPPPCCLPAANTCSWAACWAPSSALSSG